MTDIGLALTVYANCVPTLSYACAVKEYSARELMDCNTAVNDAIRKIFSFNRWESVRSLRKDLGFMSITVSLIIVIPLIVYALSIK